MKTLFIVLTITSSLTGTLVKSSATAQPMNGLRGDYFNGPNFEKKVLSRTDAQIDFRWDGQSPAPGVGREYFSVRWTGKLYAPSSGVYKFSALVDDGIRVWVGGKKVIDEWRKQDDSNFIGEITLRANQSYDLKVEYYNDWKGSAIQLYWDSPADRTSLLGFHSNAKKVIPAKYLSAPTPARKPTPPRPVVVAPVVKKPVIKPVAAVRKPTVAPAPAAKRAAEKPAPAPPPLVAQQPFSELPEPVLKPVVPEPVAAALPDKTIAVKQVQFEQSSYNLSSGSVADLDRLVSTLRANPALHIEIGGHTDTVGDPRLNVTLSEYRAKVVATYLTRRGIAEDRIAVKGYGGSRPVADNTVATERLKNRRVEILFR